MPNPPLECPHCQSYQTEYVGQSVGCCNDCDTNFDDYRHTDQTISIGPNAMPRKPQTPEAVDHPAHYGGADNPYEAIKVIRAWQLNFNIGNAAKYISRAGKKPGADRLTDLRKAVQYLRFEIEELEQAAAPIV